MEWIDAIKEIREAKNKNQLVIFVGAGVSKNSGLPTWAELIQVLANKLQYDHCMTCGDRFECEKEREKCKRRNQFTQEEFLRIPEYYYQKNPDGYYDLISEVLNKEAASNEIDNEVLRIAPQHIITTNYDNLLENAESINTGLYSVIAKDQDLLSKANTRYIIKMHGDFSCIQELVLKESDYINYEHNYVLISTFIKSLLVNNTFLFIGYSLNDYNLNLIIGWINYFAKVNEVEKRPNSFILVSDPVSDLEIERLKRKRITVVDTNQIEAEIVEKYASSKLKHEKGRRIHAFLKLISDDTKYMELIPYEDELKSNYPLLSAYNYIAYKDFKKNCHINNIEYLGRVIFFPSNDELRHFEETYNNSPEMQSLIEKTGIIGAKVSNGNERFELDANKTLPDGFQEYLDNDYSLLRNKTSQLCDPSAKLYYSVMLGASPEELRNTLEDADSVIDKSDLVAILLSKIRRRYAAPFVDYYGERQQVSEIVNLFAYLNADYKNATSFLYDLFHSLSDDHIAMQKELDKQEEHYKYYINGFRTGHAFQHIWKLQSYAYDYYFYFKCNFLPIDGYAEPQNYFSYYLQSILCSYSPVKESEDDFFIQTHREHYLIEEIDLDMFVKFVNPKVLSKWLTKYHVAVVEIDKTIDIGLKYRNLCNSVKCIYNRDFAKFIHSFSILISRCNSQEMKEETAGTLIDLLSSIVEKNIDWLKDVFATVSLLDSAIILLKSVNIDGIAEECRSFVDSALKAELFKHLNQNIKWRIVKIIALSNAAYNESYRLRLFQSIEKIDGKEKNDAIEMFRNALPKDALKDVIFDNLPSISTETIFSYIAEGYIDPTKDCEKRFLEQIEKLHLDRIKNSSMRTYPDYLQINLNDYIILHLVDDCFDIQKLKPYIKHSKYLEFLLNPDTFDYSLIDTGDYMWANIIKTPKYQKYFLDQKEPIIEDLMSAVDNNVETKDQQKLLYGLFIDKEELWKS